MARSVQPLIWLSALLNCALTLEYGTLTLLITNQGVAISRKELLEKVWDIHYEGASNVIDTVILTLRKKLRDKAILIQSVRGIGYRFIGAE